MSRALADWNVDITFAEHGLKALEAIREGKGHLLFLDLTMPIMNGYEVLERIKRDDLPCITIVVSGDIQTKAREKVFALGAIGFIEKPINAETLKEALQAYGLLTELEPQPNVQSSQASQTIGLLEHLRETANIAMGKTAQQLSEMLNLFIHLPVPRVDYLSFSELTMTLNQASENKPVTTISQGFVGIGVAGEALLLFQESSIQDLAEVLHYEHELSDMAAREVLMDIANVLTSAFFANLSHLLKLSLSRATPKILGLHCEPPNLKESLLASQKLLCIEIDYRFGEKNTHCDLLVLFTNDSLPTLKKQLVEVQ